MLWNMKKTQVYASIKTLPFFKKNFVFFFISGKFKVLSNMEKMLVLDYTYNYFETKKIK